MIKLIPSLVIFSLVFSSLQEDVTFDYLKNGTDWVNNYLLCDNLYSNQAPLNIVTNNTISFNYKFYLFPMFTSNTNATLNLENDNNNLVLNSSPGFTLGSITYVLNNSDIGEISEVNVECRKMYFRIPGEHVVDGNRYDMEIQLYCTLKDSVVTFFALPVKLSSDSSNFFSNLANISLNKEFTISSTLDILSPVTIYKRIFHYQGSMNFPDCDISKFWFFIDSPLRIDQNTYNTVWGLLDKTKAPNGNARQASDPSTGDNVPSTVYFLDAERSIKK